MTERDLFSAMPLATLIEEVDRLETELARARRVLRAKQGGHSTAGRSRRRKVTDEEVLLLYMEHRGYREWPNPGAVHQTAAKLPVSYRTVSRILLRNRAQIEERVRARLGGGNGYTIKC